MTSVSQPKSTRDENGNTVIKTINADATVDQNGNVELKLS